MKRNRFHCFALLFPLYVLFASAMIVNAKETQDKRPNIVIVLADDLGIGDTSCYGATVFTDQ